MTAHTSVVVRAKQLAAEGYGVEDLAVKLRISKESAWWFVFGKEKTAK